MKKMGTLKWYAAIGLIVLSVCLSGQGQGWARGDRMIYVYGSEQGDQIECSLEPIKASVGRDTRVIWANESDSEIQVIFLHGKECELSTYGTLGWKMNKSCYITDKTIPPGGTTSAVFKNIGVYEYAILFVNKNRKLKGAIIVASQPEYPPC